MKRKSKTQFLVIVAFTFFVLALSRLLNDDLVLQLWLWNIYMKSMDQGVSRDMHCCVRVSVPESMALCL